MLFKTTTHYIQKNCINLHYQVFKEQNSIFLREKDLSKPSKTSPSSFYQELFANAKPRSS